jgi:hypothetical membrane protein
MNSRLRRAGGYAAIAAPILMWSGFFAAALGRHGYDLLTRPFSDLATRGTVNSGLFDIGFFLVPGLLTTVVAVGLWHAGEGPAWRLGAALIGGAGLFLFATGVFQQDPSSSAASILHGTVSQICFAIASVAPVVLFAASFGTNHLRPPRQVWLMTGIAAAVIEGVGVALRPVYHYPDGLFQRPFTLALTVWFVATGAWLLRLRGAEGTVIAD